MPYATCTCEHPFTDLKSDHAICSMGECTSNETCAIFLKGKCTGGNATFHPAKTACVPHYSDERPMFKWTYLFGISTILLVIYLAPYRAFERAPWHATAHRETAVNYILTILFFASLNFMRDSPGCIAVRCAFAVGFPYDMLAILGIAFMNIVPSEIIASWKSLPKPKSILEHKNEKIAGGTNRAQAAVTRINKQLKKLYQKRGGMKIVQAMWMIIDSLGMGYAKLLDSMLHDTLGRLYDDEINFVIARINFALLAQLCPSRHDLFAFFYTGISVENNAKLAESKRMAARTPHAGDRPSRVSLTDFRSGSVGQSIQNMKDEMFRHQTLAGSLLMKAEFIIAIARPEEAHGGIQSGNSTHMSSDVMNDKMKKTLARAFGVPAYYVNVSTIQTKKWKHHFNMLSSIKVERRKGSSGVMRVSSTDHAFVKYVGKFDDNRMKLTTMLLVEVSSADQNLRQHLLFGETGGMKQMIERKIGEVYDLKTAADVVISKPRFKTTSTNRGRLGGLNAASKAILLDAVVKRFSSVPLRIQRMMLNVFNNTHGKEMYFLKGKN